MNAINFISISIGTTGIIVAILIGIYQVRAGHTKRRLEYEIVSDAPIIAANNIIRGKGNLEILLDGRPIKNARVLVIRIKNTGNTSIRKEDYFEPMVFVFQTKIINADILETNPSDLIPPEARENFLTLNAQSIKLPEFPLNKRESITISILIEDDKEFIVRARLDQGEISEFKPKRSEIYSLILTIFSVTILFTGIIFKPLQNNSLTYLFLISLIIFTLGSIISSIDNIVNKRKRDD